MFWTMVPKPLLRQLVSLVIVLGVILAGAAPSWAAMPANGAMSPGMSITAMAHGDCMGMVDPGTANKNLPGKNNDIACGMCAICGVLVSEAPLAELLVRAHEVVFTRELDRSGIAILPALPPPIA
jgi:hypothetical protein